MMEWEWYTDSKMVHLFMHLVIKANIKPNKWKGVEVNRGQLITGRKKLSKETGISEQSIRTCLNRFVSTNELTIESTSLYSLITICNYDEYQNNKRCSNQPSNQQNPNKQPTTNHNQRSKEEKKEYILTLENSDYTPAKNEEAIKLKELIDEVNKEYPALLKMQDPLSVDQLRRLVLNNNTADVLNIFNAMENHPQLLKKYKSAYRTAFNWLRNRRN